ncbi:hypothetical protein E4U13_006276 [Claviceps humidiphila]|uniref:Uncharacterized protein n=1 Tax=Claviceps humidiphila TaxID=1294629 RepID=A0A9P7TT81_9HYPO|nr:hypothetical protein E4U13_006276 [Claviceps humidiphila]
MAREMSAAEEAAAEDSAALNSTLHSPPTSQSPKTLQSSTLPSSTLNSSPTLQSSGPESTTKRVTASIGLVISGLEKRAASRQLLHFKADRMELMYESEALGDSDEFIIPKGEGGGLNSTGHDEGVDLSCLGRDDDPDDFSRIDQLDISFLSKLCSNPSKN